MPKNRIVFPLLAVLILCGCVLRVEQDDLFRPDWAGRIDITKKYGKIDKYFIRNNKVDPEYFRIRGVRKYIGKFPSALGSIEYRFARLEKPENRRMLIVYCGGSAFEARAHGDLIYLGLLGKGSVLLWNYPGYGESSGRPGASDLRKILPDVVRLIDQKREWPGQKVMFWGHSLGGFVCAELAGLYSTDPAAPIAFEATAADAEAAARGFASGSLLRLKIAPEIAQFDIIKALGPTPRAALVLASADDTVIPAALSRELAEALAAAGHDVSYHEYDDAGHFWIMWQELFSKHTYDFILGKALGLGRKRGSGTPTGPPA